MTHKLVGNKEVVIIDHAIDYVKQQGYLVVKPKNYRTLLSLTIVIAILLLSFSTFAKADEYSDCSIYGNCEPFRVITGEIINISSFGNLSGSGLPNGIAVFDTPDSLTSYITLYYDGGSDTLFATEFSGGGTGLSGVCLSNGNNCIFNFSKLAKINESNNFTKTQYFNNGTDLNKVTRIRNYSVASSNSWDIYTADDYGIGSVGLHIEPSFSGGQYLFLGSSAHSIYAMDTSAVANWFNVPASMIQLTASNAGGYCQGRTCSVVGNPTGDFVIYKSNGNFITTQHISDGSSQPFDFKTYYNTSSYAGGWDNKGAMYNFDTQGSANTFPNNISLALFKIAGITKANLTNDGSLILNGNVTANIYKNSSGSSGLTKQINYKNWSSANCTMTFTAGILTGDSC